MRRRCPEQLCCYYQDNTPNIHTALWLTFLFVAAGCPDQSSLLFHLTGLAAAHSACLTSLIAAADSIAKQIIENTPRLQGHQVSVNKGHCDKLCELSTHLLELMKHHLQPSHERLQLAWNSYQQLRTALRECCKSIAKVCSSLGNDGTCSLSKEQSASFGKKLDDVLVCLRDWQQTARQLDALARPYSDEMSRPFAKPVRLTMAADGQNHHIAECLDAEDAACQLFSLWPPQVPSSLLWQKLRDHCQQQPQLTIVR